jgi:hypothetical protein
MNCIFGLFDVLGFSSFCENCEPQDAEKVLKIMDDFETEIPEALLVGLLPGISPEKKQQVKSLLRWLTFSDTVFVAIPYEVTDNSEDLKFNLIFFTFLVAYINRRMFEIGLPVRGAVHIGDAIISKRCFAGKAIVEALRLAEKCQIAGTVFSDQAHKFMSDTFSTPKSYHFTYRDLIVQGDVPTGNKAHSESFVCTTSEKMNTLSWFYLQFENIQDFVVPLDLSRFVNEKFTDHGKKLSGDKEKMKAVYTERLFNCWKAAAHLQYLRAKVKGKRT